MMWLANQPIQRIAGSARGPWRLLLLALVILASGVSASFAADLPGVERFRREVQPVLSQYCYDCHGDGAKKGGVAFDELTSEQVLLQNPEFWSKVLKNLRAGIMPPAKKPRPSERDRRILEN